MTEIPHNPEAVFPEECDCIDCQIKVRKMEMYGNFSNYFGKESWEGEGISELNDSQIDRLRDRNRNDL